MKFRWKHHLSDGHLRAYLDSQTGLAESARIDTHLEVCASCRTRLENFASRAARVSAHIQKIKPADGMITPTRAARARLDQSIQQKESYPMIQKLFSKRYRGALIAATIVILLTISLTIPQVRAIAVDFLGLFRVDKVAVVPVDLNNLPDQLGDSTTLQNLFSNYVKVEQNGNPIEVSNVDSLSQAAGFPVRLPQEIDGQPALEYQPGGTATLTVNVEQIQMILNEIGREDIQIPDGIDGEEIVVTIPGAAVAQYGTCKYDSKVSRDAGYDPDSESAPMTPLCTTFMQMPSPTVETKPGIDIQSIGLAYLQLLGLSPEQAVQYSENIDWTTTLVIPMPTNEANYTSVMVDGVEGTLMTSLNYDDATPQYALVWVNDGMLHFLTGPGNAENAVNIASSLR